jgi:hypothetical protein
MDVTLYYAFMDESGTVGASAGTHFLVVAVLATPNPRGVEKPIRRLMKKFGPNLGTGEVKAADFDEAVILRLLSEISEEKVTIMATIVDQRAIRIPPKDMEDVYRQAVAWTVRNLAEEFPRLNLMIDKRYTNAHLRRLLEEAIRDEVENLPRQNIIIQQENSVLNKGLQAVDAVAWALFEKYERGDLRFYNVIAPNIVKETMIRKKDWT